MSALAKSRRGITVKSDVSYAGVDDAIRALIAKWGVPGMTVGILRNGKVDSHRFY